MAEPAFDTSRFQDTLSGAGIPLAHARAITRAVVDVTDHLPSADALAAFKAEIRAEIAELRTELKGEIAELRTELKGEIAELRTELKGEIAALRADLFKALGDQARWTAGLVLGAVVLNAAVVAGVGLALYNALKG